MLGISDALVAPVNGRALSFLSSIRSGMSFCLQVLSSEGSLRAIACQGDNALSHQRLCSSRRSKKRWTHTFLSEGSGHLQKTVLSVYHFIGVASAEKGNVAFPHTLDFEVDEASIGLDVSRLSSLIFNLLEE